MNKLKLIFLDVDGVLNNNDTRVTTKDGWCFVDDELVSRLSEIVHKTGAKVILSSTWREGWNKKDESKNASYFNELRDKLLEYDVHLFDKTPEVSRTHIRGDAIGEWFGSIDYDVESYIILDDYNDMGCFSSHLLQTAGGRGLTEEDVEMAITYLNKKNWVDLSLKKEFGYWKELTEDTWKCAKCGSVYKIQFERFLNYRYCPYCGRRNILYFDYINLDWHK